jgi:ABC-type lipoprotein export system ATPase subunit
MLFMLAGLERPDAGEVVVGGQPLSPLDRAQLADLRRGQVGVVGQDPGLVAFLTARENVSMALTVRGVDPGQAAALAGERLASVGLAERAGQLVSRLSAGERQRVAIARALAAEVELLLVDEPTARLDEENGRAAGALLARAARERGMTVVCATHDPVLIELADEVVALE